MSKPKPNVSEHEARAVAEGARETTWEAPSFVRELFLGKLDLGLIHPWPEPDPEEQKRAEPCLARLEQFLRKADLALSRVLDCHFHFRTLEDVDSISAFLARMYPVPADALVGIRELMLNAVEHGNLAITYAEKSKLHAEGKWASEITRRLELPDYAKRRAHVALSRVDDGIALTIQDEGDGFDWARYASFDPSALAHQMSKPPSPPLRLLAK